MGVVLHLARVGRLDRGFTAKCQKYIQDAAGQDGLIAKVFCMAGIQHGKGKANASCQTSSDSHQGSASGSVRGSSFQVTVNVPSEGET